MGVWGKLRLTLNSVTVYKTCFMRIIYYFLIVIMIKKKKKKTQQSIVVGQSQKRLFLFHKGDI